MNKSVKSILLSLALLACSISLSYAKEYKTLHIAADVSASNPIVASKVYAGIIAQNITAQIAALNYGDYVDFRTFGHLELDNLPRIKLRLTKKNRPAAIAKIIARSITTIPEGRIAPQSATEIISQLEWGEYNCAAGDIIILATDGIEASSLVPNPNKLLNGEVGLPEPMTKGYLSGCTVVMLGVGKTKTGSWPSTGVRNLVKVWTTYLNAAGAEFKILPNP